MRLSPASHAAPGRPRRRAARSPWRAAGGRDRPVRRRGQIPREARTQGRDEPLIRPDRRLRVARVRDISFATAGRAPAARLVMSRARASSAAARAIPDASRSRCSSRHARSNRTKGLAKRESARGWPGVLPRAPGRGILARGARAIRKGDPESCAAPARDPRPLPPALAEDIPAVQRGERRHALSRQGDRDARGAVFRPRRAIMPLILTDLPRGPRRWARCAWPSTAPRWAASARAAISSRPAARRPTAIEAAEAEVERLEASCATAGGGGGDPAGGEAASARSRFLRASAGRPAWPAWRPARCASW